jgi:arylsulfatase A-like enzyme
MVGAASALVSAAVYAVPFGVRYRMRGEIVNVSRDLAWMAPLSSLLFFGLAAAGVLILVRLMSPTVATRVTYGTFAGLTLFSILLPYAQIATLAAFVLALGVGVSVARWAVDRPYAAIRVCRRATLTLAALFAIAAVAIEWRMRGQVRAALASIPAPLAGYPNVLLVVLDAARASSFSAYGAPRPTSPHLDQLAREGATFERAFSVAPWTLPSHESMFTGRYQFVEEGSPSFLRRRTEDGAPTLQSIFHARGYETAGFVANFYYTGWDSGLDRGFARYRDYPRSFEQLVRSSVFGRTLTVERMLADPTARGIGRAISRPDLFMSGRPTNEKKPATTITDEFVSWMSEREPRPWFVFLNYIDAHEPLVPPAPFDSRFAVQPYRRHLYEGAIAYMDAEVDRLLDTLRVRGVLDSTLVVITSDHGELLGEHGITGHHSSLYFEVLHVPLVMRLPGRIPAGLRVADPVLELAGGEAAGQLPGVSLATHWRATKAQTSPIFAAVERGVRVDSTLPFAKGDMVSMLDGRWHYIRNNGSGEEDLFDYRADAAETRDLVGSPGSDSVVARFRAEIRTLVDREGRASSMGTRR